MGINFNGMPKSAQGTNFVKPQASGLTDKSDTVGSPEERQAGETVVKDVDVSQVIVRHHYQDDDGNWHHTEKNYGADDKIVIDYINWNDGRYNCVGTYDGDMFLVNPYMYDPDTWGDWDSF